MSAKHKTRNIHPPSIQDLDPCSLEQLIRISPPPARSPRKKRHWNVVTRVISIYIPAATVDLLGQREWQYDRRDVNYRLEVRMQMKYGNSVMATSSEEDSLA
jgi:hypothetical protein